MAYETIPIYKRVVCHPLYQTTNQGAMKHCSIWKITFSDGPSSFRIIARLEQYEKQNEIPAYKKMAKIMKDTMKQDGFWKGVQKEAKEYTFPVNDHMAGWKSTVLNRKYILNWCIFQLAMLVYRRVHSLKLTFWTWIVFCFPAKRRFLLETIIGRGRTVSFGECKGSHLSCFFPCQRFWLIFETHGEMMTRHDSHLLLVALVMDFCDYPRVTKNFNINWLPGVWCLMFNIMGI